MNKLFLLCYYLHPKFRALSHAWGCHYIYRVFSAFSTDTNPQQHSLTLYCIWSGTVSQTTIPNEWWQSWHYLTEKQVNLRCRTCFYINPPQSTNSRSPFFFFVKIIVISFFYYIWFYQFFYFLFFQEIYACKLKGNGSTRASRFQTGNRQGEFKASIPNPAFPR